MKARPSVKRFVAVAALAAGLLGGAAAQAAELRVLSAGALEPAMAAAAGGFHRRTGHILRIEYATATAIRERAVTGLSAGLVAAPDTVVAELAQAGKVAGEPPAGFGRVGMGVAVRTGAPVPDISTVAALKATLLGAGTVIYNRASSGTNVEAMVQALGIAQALAPRTQRYPDATAVMTRLIGGGPDEVALGAVTAIGLYRDKGVRLVGPVPAAVQSYTVYTAAAVHAADPVAHAFLDYLASPGARALIAEAGVEPAG
ncbi:MAG TPA: substrate-binding domain-containing protein [Caulobacteraceae bacterium]|jgi:molybdate transport system substrate-binding protein|nr:substrate-binding domain-containing protein [Caulobacteraceae bacterium]